MVPYGSNTKYIFFQFSLDLQRNTSYKYYVPIHYFSISHFYNHSIYIPSLILVTLISNTEKQTNVLDVVQFKNGRCESLCLCMWLLFSFCYRNSYILKSKASPIQKMHDVNLYVCLCDYYSLFFVTTTHIYWNLEWILSNCAEYNNYIKPLLLQREEHSRI